MISLETHINSLDFSRQLEVVRDLMETAEVKTSFWGSRVVEVEGYSGSVYLDSLAERVQRTVYARDSMDYLRPGERIAGIEIVRKLQQFYIETDNQIESSNCLTRLFNWIREFSFVPYYSSRFYIQGNVIQKFQTYSRDHFLQQFGGVIDERGRHPAAEWDDWGPSEQMVAKEMCIGALLFHDALRRAFFASL